MKTRRSRKPKSPEDVLLPFVEVKVEPKMELLDGSEEVLQTQANQNPTPEIENKHGLALQSSTSEHKSSKICYKRSRAVQVDSEDIDVISAKNLRPENKPIEPIGTEPIIPQCRFCLRRVSRAKLKIIVNKHKLKALAALQIRVYPSDAYPFACVNCLNMIDMFLDYKSAVTKAQYLLVNKRTYLESNGWDDENCIEAFNQSKATIERHLMQIDATFDEQVAREQTRNEPLLESKEELISEEKEEPNNYDDVFHDQSTKTTDEIVVEPGHKFQFRSDVMEADQMSISDLNIEENIDGELMSCADPKEHVDNHNIVKAKMTNIAVDKDDALLRAPTKRRKTKAVKYTEPEQPQGDEDCATVDFSSSDDGDYVPESLKAAPKKSNTLTNPEEETDDESLLRVKEDYSIKQKNSRSSKFKIKRNKPRKPRIKNSVLERAPEPNSSTTIHVLCDLCGEKLRPESIESHKNNRHFGIKPYTCPVDGCDARFSGRINMATHMRRWHPENGVPCRKCDICLKTIRGVPTVFNQHRKRHFLKEKSHVCSVCGKGFTLGRYLKQHSIIHTGLLPHECSYCGKKFNNKWSMKTHEKTMHEKKMEASTGPDLDLLIDAAAAGTSYAE